MANWVEPGPTGALRLTDQGAATAVSLGLVCFLMGRFTGAGILHSSRRTRCSGLYGVMNVLMCILVVLKLGWLSVACVFLSYFFMSIMFPTIFALGIHGLGARAKQASAFIVMAIMGGAILPKAMGAVGDAYDMSRAFIVPLGLLRLRGVLRIRLAAPGQGRVADERARRRRALRHAPAA